MHKENNFAEFGRSPVQVASNSPKHAVVCILSNNLLLNVNFSYGLSKI